MHPNGVSHLEVGNDQEGVDRILQWLSYVPKTAGSLPVARPVTDPVEREVGDLPIYLTGPPSVVVSLLVHGCLRVLCCSIMIWV